MELVLIGIIFIYGAFVIYRKIEDIKKGKYCSCGCENCNGKQICLKEERKEVQKNHGDL